MRVPLQLRVSLFVVLCVVSLSLVGTLLFAWFLRDTAEREIIVRGTALCQSLARAAADGLADEDLDLLDRAAYIVRSDDALITQVYSSLWSPIQAYPFDALHAPPAPGAQAHFKQSDQPYVEMAGGRYEFYAPVVLRIPQVEETTIGFARLALSSAALRQSLVSVVVGSLLLAVAITLIFVGGTYVLIGRTVLFPLMGLHRAVGQFRDGRVVEMPPSRADDEIADLSREFKAMSQALKDREESLSQEKERLTVTLRSIGEGVLVSDADGRVSLLNRAAEMLTGWAAAEAAGRPFCEVFNVRNVKSGESCENIVARVLATGEVASLGKHSALIRKGGEQIVVEDSAAPIFDREGQIIGVVLVFRDVTEKERIEAERLKTEKLQSLGVLAGGIAHDFNNLLTGILGNISLARMAIGPDGAGREPLGEAETATRRAAELAKQLLTFSRGGLPQKRAAAIDEVMKESARFILSGTKVAPVFLVAAEAWPVEIDPGQMSQVFNNLTLNAVQAMPGGGTITFTVENVTLVSGEVATLAPGDYLRISVHDQGPGIAAADLVRVFDPYFTTKSDGGGLGLTSAYSIVSKHGGHLAATSAPGRGATFVIHLPAARGATLCPAPAPAETLFRGEGPILVMDDEKAIRQVAAQMLKALGYTATTARDGTEALELYERAQRQGRPFKAVILDLTIPGGMGGKETIERLLAIDPAARVVVSTGYSNDPVMADYRSHGYKGAIVKPYNLKSFSRALRDVLEWAPP